MRAQDVGDHGKRTLEQLLVLEQLIGLQHEGLPTQERFAAQLHQVVLELRVVPCEHIRACDQRVDAVLRPQQRGDERPPASASQPDE